MITAEPKALMENRSSVEEGMARVSQMLDMLLEVSFVLVCCLLFAWYGTSEFLRFGSIEPS